MVRHRRAQKADLPAGGDAAGEGRLQGRQRPEARGAVEMAGGAETASAPAAAIHLREVHPAEFRPRGGDDLLREKIFQGIFVARADGARERGVERLVAPEEGVGAVVRPVEPRDISAGKAPLDFHEEFLARQACGCGFGERLQEAGDQALPLAQEIEIEEIGRRLRVQGEGDAAADDQRMPAPPLGGQQRKPGRIEHGEDIRVVVLEGDREGDDIEVPQGPAGLDAQRLRPAGPPLPIVRRGEEGPFAQK